MRNLYQNNLKNREFDKEAPQIFCPEQGTVFTDTDRGEDEKSEAKPTRSKTNFSSCLGILITLVCFVLLGASPTMRTLYNSLDPLSVVENLAFHELYPDTAEGKEALARAWKLLSEGGEAPSEESLTLPKFDIQAIISLVTRQSFDPPVRLDAEQLALIEKLGRPLGNRKLKGSTIWTKEELLALPFEEVDLSRGLLINQFDTSTDLQGDVRQYEAHLDLIALQILARLPKEAPPEEKIRAINRFIFQEMQFRFPPHSLYAKDIDLYTFLPSVLDSRRGVCLGVSILYIALAQRLELPLEIITPPGHIYVRYRKPDGGLINIETTARGINLPSETYLGINTRSLTQANLKQVIGWAFVNQASVAWGREDYATTVSLYEKARPYLPGEPLLNMFLGFNYLFVGKKKEGEALLRELKDYTFDFAVSPESIPSDYLNGKVDVEGLKAVFLSVDETRDSIVAKQQKLEKILKRYPKYRAGLLQLATTWIQLGRGNEALEALLRYHRIDPNDATVEYYLSILSLERFDYNSAWGFLKRAETLTSKRDHYPKALKGLRHELRSICPD